MNDSARVSLRPFLPADAPALAALFRAAIEELTGDDYDADQQEAWAAAADDEEAFGARLAGLLTLVALRSGAPVGFLALKDDSHIDLLYVHPEAVETGVAATLCAAAEALAHGRGAKAVTVDASDTALGFFLHRGYQPERRNTVSLGGEWLSNTTLRKVLGEGGRLQ
ncbi:GNAT family N-acetyltransferase [Xanthobacter agilis]|jgi:putative acetyltransferase|uniref:Acetyltransferase n=1 Tax=Xanthobacter agilis TaxID=47492 RepID=A0ABU0LH61_XANAG|nr:GNAT family N-acetyltransferase [Xanthobacter agilis]MDQ0506484.1 putative acetyltransferase [Xanthobacter agilis]